MISTPYATLHGLPGYPNGWMPEWAQRRTVHRTEAGETVYIAQPESLDPAAITELQELVSAGWRVEVDGPRLGRIRIRMTRSAR